MDPVSMFLVVPESIKMITLTMDTLVDAQGAFGFKTRREKEGIIRRSVGREWRS